MAIAPGQQILQGDMANVALTANSKNSLLNLQQSNYPYNFPDWNPMGVGGNNLVQNGSQYDNGGNFSLGGLSPGLNYFVTLGGNDISFSTGGKTYTQSSIFTADSIGGIAMAGQPGEPVTATVILFPGWLTELNNMRSDLMQVIGPLLGGTTLQPGQIAPWVWNSISGDNGSSIKVPGWPIGQPSLNNQYLNFWYLDNGTAQYVNVSTNAYIGIGGSYAGDTPFQTGVYNSYSGVIGMNYNDFYNSRYVTDQSGNLQVVAQQPFGTEVDYTLVVGGNPGTDGGGSGDQALTIPLKCDLYIPIGIYRGCSITFQVAYGWFPGDPPPAGANSTYFELPEGYNGITFTPDAGAIPQPQVDTSNFIPGASFSYVAPASWSDIPDYQQSNPQANWGGTNYVMWLVCHLNANVAPGTYMLKIKYPLPVETFTQGVPDQNDNALVVNFTGPFTIPSYVNLISYSFEGTSLPVLQSAPYDTVRDTWSTLGPTSSFSYEFPINLSEIGPGVPAPGVSNTENVLRIDCSSLYGETSEFPAGLWQVLQSPTNSDWQNQPYPEPQFTAPIYQDCTTGWSITGTVPGLWSAKNNPISGLSAPPASFPWNFSINENGNVFNPYLSGGNTASEGANTYGATVESRPEPAGWSANTRFTPGVTIVDSNGNFQQCVGAGISGPSPPGWGGTGGYTTNDNQVTWKCVGVPVRSFCAGTNGRMWGGSPFYSFQGYSGATPTYPYYLFGETNLYLQPPSPANATTMWGCDSQWHQSANQYAGWQTNNKAYGLWIYSLNINRIGSNLVNGAILPTLGVLNYPEQIDVEIGCIRNGQFVSFGTFQTGSTYQVLWPIFTSDCLVYQASERVDLQALAITNVFGGTEVNGYPMAASYVLDTISMLGLVS